MKRAMVQFLMTVGVMLLSPAAWALERSGFFDLPSAAASGTGDPRFSFNSAGGLPTFVRTATGVYEVTFQNLADFSGAPGSGGDVQVSAREAFKHCNPLFWNNDGTNLKITVACFDRFGLPSNSQFVAAFRRQVNPVDQPTEFPRAYVFSSNEVPPTAAPPLYSANSKGGSNGVIWVANGKYRVFLSQMFDPASGGSVMVSAYGTSGGMRYCKVGGWFQFPGTANDLEVDVNCFGAGGTPANSRFSLSFGTHAFNKIGAGAFAWDDQPLAAWATPSTLYQRVVLSKTFDTANYSGTANGGPITAIQASPGSYRLTIPTLNAVGPSNALVTAYGDDASYCWLTNWMPSGSAQALNLACGTPFGSVVSSRFVAQFGIFQPSGF